MFGSEEVEKVKVVNENKVSALSALLIENFKCEYSSLEGDNLGAEPFSTFWNENIATMIVNVDDKYLVFLGLIDNNNYYYYPVDPFSNYWGKERKRIKNSSYQEAKEESSWLQDRLSKEDNPIFFIHPRCDLNSYFHCIVCDPYVNIKILKESGTTLPFSNYDLENIINQSKIGDIIFFRRKRLKFFYYHSEIYIGKGKTIGMKNRGGIVISSIEENMRSEFFTGKVVKFHPIIPFKKIDLLLKQAILHNISFWDKYILEDRNCQHFANSCVFGINYSEEIEVTRGLKTLAEISGSFSFHVTNANLICSLITLTFSPLILLPSFLVVAPLAFFSSRCIVLLEREEYDYLGYRNLMNSRSNLNELIGREEEIRVFIAKEKIEKINLKESIIETNSFPLLEEFNEEQALIDGEISEINREQKHLLLEETLALYRENLFMEKII